ncbi:MAG: ABC transporter permease [Chloroflexi bacterium]|nr:MAG: ABC transporter permease [Chloroflexota bacterium]
MARFILRRLLLLLVTLFVTSMIVFALTQLLPGDVARLILGREAGEQALINLRAELGLNDPIPVQYIKWLSGFIVGDWGVAFGPGRPEILPLVAERLGNSLRLAFFALALSIPLGILLGLAAGLKPGGIIDGIVSIFSLSVVGLPEFVTGLVLINIFAIQLDILPASASTTEANLIEWIRRLLLPAITATLVLLGYIARMTRAGVIDEMRKPYVRMATLKGLPRRTIIFKHVLRNALLPTITIIAISFGWLIGGIVIIESVFSYNGIGRLIIDAVGRKDIPLLQAVVMVVVVFYALASLVADLLYAALNPRIRLE